MVQGFPVFNISPVLGGLYELRFFDLHPSDFRPYDLSAFLVTIVDGESSLSSYLWSFVYQIQNEAENFFMMPGRGMQFKSRGVFERHLIQGEAFYASAVMARFEYQL